MDLMHPRPFFRSYINRERERETKKADVIGVLQKGLDRNCWCAHIDNRVGTIIKICCNGPALTSRLKRSGWHPSLYLYLGGISVLRSDAGDIPVLFLYIDIRFIRD